MTRRRWYAVAAAALALVACGKGGGGRAPAQATAAAVLQLEVAGRVAPIASTFGGEELRIVGTNATEILIDNVPVAAVPVSDGEISAVTPPHAPGAVDVTVLDQVLPDAIEYRAPPALVGVRAADGPTAGTARVSVDGGATLTVKGRDLRPPVDVSVGGVTATVLGVEDGEVSFAAPALAQTGPVAVVVRNEDGLSGTATVTYTDEFSLAPRAAPLDREAAQHLFRRAGFGAAPG
ncbi:MAG: IPT/TIG domain-containing protein, partial [Planctomycetota bacterium]|nr:IPT/TIG domain-containing protein [Planctomycetota bacterium]